VVFGDELGDFGSYVKSSVDNILGFPYIFIMSPTIFLVGNYRFYFFSREEEMVQSMLFRRTARRNSG